MTEIKSGGLPPADPPAPRPRRPEPSRATAGEVAKQVLEDDLVESRLASHLVLPAGWYTLRPTGELCGACHAEHGVLNPMYRTPHGDACPDGHGEPPTFPATTDEELGVIAAARRTFAEHSSAEPQLVPMPSVGEAAARIRRLIPQPPHDVAVLGQSFALETIAREILALQGDDRAAAVLGGVLARLVLGQEPPA